MTDKYTMTIEQLVEVIYEKNAQVVARLATIQRYLNHLPDSVGGMIKEDLHHELNMLVLGNDDFDHNQKRTYLCQNDGYSRNDITLPHIESITESIRYFLSEKNETRSK